MLKRGFTLLEVLVTLVVLLLGLLGLAGMMVKGQRASFEAYQNQQASNLAQSMVENIKANRQSLAAYIINSGGAAGLSRTNSGNAAACPSANCSGNDLAKDDLLQWRRALTGAAEQLDGGNVGSILEATGCIQALAAPAGASAGTIMFRVSVAWLGKEITFSNPDTLLNCASGAAWIPAASEGGNSRRRLIFLDTQIYPS